MDKYSTNSWVKLNIIHKSIYIHTYIQIYNGASRQCASPGSKNYVNSSLYKCIYECVFCTSKLQVYIYCGYSRLSQPSLYILPYHSRMYSYRPLTILVGFCTHSRQRICMQKDSHPQYIKIYDYIRRGHDILFSIYTLFIILN